MKCQWKECENDAAVILFRLAGPIGQPGRSRRSARRRTRNENLVVCEACQPAAQTEYPFLSFVHVEDYDKNFNLGCWG